MYDAGNTHNASDDMQITIGKLVLTTHDKIRARELLAYQAGIKRGVDIGRQQCIDAVESCSSQAKTKQVKAMMQIS